MSYQRTGTLKSRPIYGFVCDRCGMRESTALLFSNDIPDPYPCKCGGIMGVADDKTGVVEGRARPALPALDIGDNDGTQEENRQGADSGTVL